MVLEQEVLTSVSYNVILYYYYYFIINKDSHLLDIVLILSPQVKRIVKEYHLKCKMH